MVTIMTIIRSSQIMSVSKKMLKKVKRPHIKWYELYNDVRTLEMDEDFYRLLNKHPRMSLDRIAYNVLKKHYSTTAIARCRWVTGVLS